MQKKLLFAVLIIIASLTYAQRPVTSVQAMKATYTEKAKVAQKQNPSVFRYAEKQQLDNARTIVMQKSVNSKSNMALSEGKYNIRAKAGKVLAKKNAAKADDGKTPVTPPTGLQTETYVCTAISYMDMGNVSYDVEVGFDGNDVYVQGLLRNLPTGWIKGTLTDGKVTFEKGQYLGDAEVNDYYTGESLGFFPATMMYQDGMTGQDTDLVLTYNAETGVLDDLAQGALYFSDGSEESMIDVLINTRLTPQSAFGDVSYDLVTPPATAQPVAVDISCQSLALGKQLAVVGYMAIDGNDIYVQGLMNDMPNAWIKGTKDANGVVTFQKGQYIGKYREQIDMWMIGADPQNPNSPDIVDVLAQWDENEQSLIFSENTWVLENSDPISLLLADAYYDITVYPHRYEIRYHVDGVLYQTQTVEEGAVIPPLEQTPVKTGHEFTGWDGLPEDMIMPNHDIIANAVFSVNSYTFTFNSNGGTEVAPITAPYGSMVTKPADPVRTYYTFKGWEPEVPEVMPAQNMTFTAQWERNVFSLTYMVDGEEYHKTTIEEGAVIPSFEAPTKNGYTFVRWDGLPEDMIMPGHDVIATAVYQNNAGEQLFVEGNSGTCHWYVTSDRELVVEPTYGTEGTLDYWSSETDVPWYSWRDEILSVEIKPGVSAKTCAFFFKDCKNLQSVNISGLNTHDVTDMGYMFFGCSSLTNVNLRNIDAQNVKDMRYMFYGCSGLKTLDLSSLNTQEVRNMKLMFSMCSGMVSLDLSHLNTAKVTDMSSMFYECSNLISLNLKGINTESVTDMRYMFYGCSALRTLDLSSLNTQNVTSTKSMFAMCSKLASLDMSNFTTQNVVDAELTGMYDGCVALNSIYSSLATPSKLKEGTFSLSFVNRANCTLYVPKGSLSSYSLNAGWKELGTIIENIKPETVAEGVLGTCRWYITKDENKLIVEPVESVNGTLDYWSSADAVPWYAWRDVILSAEIKPGVSAKTCAFFFQDCKNMQSVNLGGLNTYDVTDMGYMFFGCSSLTSIDFKYIDSRNVKDMRYMFYGCSNLTTIDLDHLNTQDVRNMKSMFSLCIGMLSLDLSHLNTAKVTDMSLMFKDCTNLTTLKLDGIDTQSVRDMRYMFYGCNALQTLDLSSLNTQNVTSMKSMFAMCSKLASLDMSNFTNLNVTEEEMKDMFAGCVKLTSIYSNNPEPSDLKSGTFASLATRTNCTLFVPKGCADTYRAASGWNELGTIIGDAQIEVMAEGTSGTCHWYITKDEKKLVIEPAESVTGTLGYWSSTDALPWYAWHDEILSAEIKPGVSAKTGAFFFKDCKNMQSVNLSGLNTRDVTDMGYMFFGCSSLTTVDLGTINTQNVTDMRYMFYGCSGLTSLDVSKLNTQKVRNMNSMFSNCLGLKVFDISSLNTENVTDLSLMFKDCTNLTALKMNGINTQNVTDMGYMFYGCSSLTSLDLSGLNTQKVQRMKSMFAMCGKLASLDLSNFTTQNVNDMNDMFAGCVKLTSIYSNVAAPSSLKGGTFSGSFEKRTDCTLYVPVGSKDAYDTAAGWNELGATISSFVYNNIIYNEVSSAQRTVMVAGLTNKSVDAINVPMIADYEGVAYNVISVGNQAFANIPGLLEVTFESTVSIPADAFEGSGTKTNLFVYAPAGSKNEYKGNVVIDGVAENVLLKDAQPLRLSREFTAKKVSYSREFTKRTYVGEAGGWETIVLPFDVENIECASGSISPFNGSAADNHFWLAQLTKGGFQNATFIIANRPYIISMPNSDDYDSEHNISGVVTFSAENAPIYKTSNAHIANGTDFRLVPTYEGVEGSASVYTINDEDMHGYHAGAVFASASRDVRPFEAYAENLQNGAKPLYFEIEGTTNGIRDIHMEVNVPTTIYDLSGRPANASQKGFIIMRDSKGKHTKIYNK